MKKGIIIAGIFFGLVLTSGVAGDIQIQGAENGNAEQAADEDKDVGRTSQAAAAERTGGRASQEEFAGETGEQASLEEPAGETGEQAAQEEPDGETGEQASQEKPAGGETEVLDSSQLGQALYGEVDLSDAQESLDELLGKYSFSLGDTVLKLMSGEMPWNLDSFRQILKDMFVREISDYRKTAVYLLVIIVASAVFFNFVSVFNKGQIADISYYMMYLLMVTLLMKVFSSMGQVAQQAVSAILKFMEALLPACILTVFITTGNVTAMGFYQITLWAVAGVQWLMNRLLIPAVQIYVILLFINQMMKEDYLSKMADLIKTVILWSLKTAMALLLGMQAIQCMVAPAVDRMKSSVISRVVSILPGIGNAYETVAETVLGAAVLLKNAVGIAGVLALVLLGLVPVVKLAVGVVLYRALGAAAQPVTDKRVAECIDCVAEGGELLLKIVFYAGILFIISLAMITAMIRGG